jgi:hypothetical protein
MAVVVASVALALATIMVKPTIAMPHHRTTAGNETTKTEIVEIEFTTRERMRMWTERSIPELAQTRTRTRTRILSRTPKLAGSAHRGVLRPAPLRSVSAGSAGMRAGRGAIVALALVEGGALDKTKRLHTDTTDERGPEQKSS